MQSFCLEVQSWVSIVELVKANQTVLRQKHSLGKKLAQKGRDSGASKTVIKIV